MALRGAEPAKVELETIQGISPADILTFTSQSLGQRQPRPAPQVAHVAKMASLDEPPRPPTTMMLRNVPSVYTQASLAQEIDSLGFSGTYDYLFLPNDRAMKGSIGYAFVNFERPEDAVRFRFVLTGHRFRLAMGARGRKTAEVCMARRQGPRNNLCSGTENGDPSATNGESRPRKSLEDPAFVEQPSFIMDNPVAATANPVADAIVPRAETPSTSARSSSRGSTDSSCADKRWPRTAQRAVPTNNSVAGNGLHFTGSCDSSNGGHKKQRELGELMWDLQKALAVAPASGSFATASAPYGMDDALTASATAVTCKPQPEQLTFQGQKERSAATDIEELQALKRRLAARLSEQTLGSSGGANVGQHFFMGEDDGYFRLSRQCGGEPCFLRAACAWA